MRLQGREIGVLGALLGLALWLRAWGLEQGYPAMYGHVDEVGVAASIWNFYRAQTLLPTEFTYPALYSYLTAAALYATNLLGWGPHWQGTVDSLVLISYLDPARAALVGRWISVLLGTATVYATFALGRRVGGVEVGMVAAALVAVARVPVGQAHQALPDTAMAFAALCALSAAWRIVEGGSWRAYLAAGAAAGLVVATKYNGALIALAIPVAHMLRAQWQWKGLGDAKLWGAIAASLVALFAGSPYIFLAAEKYWSVASYQVSSLDFAQTQTQPWWWIVRSLLEYEWGVGGAMLLGMGWALWRRGPFEKLLLSTWMPSFIYIGSWTRESLHYVLHFYPLWAIAAALALNWARRRMALGGAWPWVGVALLVAPSAYAGVESGRRMAQPDVRQQATAWMEQRADEGTVLATTWLPYGPQLELQAARRGLVEAYRSQPQVLAILEQYWADRPAFELVNLEIWLKEPVVPAAYRPHVDLDDPETRRVFSRGWLSPRQLKSRGVRYIVLPEAAYGRYLEGDPPPGGLSAAHYHYAKNRAYFSNLIDPANGQVERVARFAARSGEKGSAIAIYRLR